MRCQLGQFDSLAFTCYCWHYAYAAYNQMHHIPQREGETATSFSLPFYLAAALCHFILCSAFLATFFVPFFAAFPFGFLHKICQTRSSRGREEKVHGERAEKKVIAIERRLPLLLLLLPVWIFLLAALTF